MCNTDYCYVTDSIFRHLHLSNILSCDKPCQINGFWLYYEVIKINYFGPVTALNLDAWQIPTKRSSCLWIQVHQRRYNISSFRCLVPLRRDKMCHNRHFCTGWFRILPKIQRFEFSTSHGYSYCQILHALGWFPSVNFDISPSGILACPSPKPYNLWILCTHTHTHIYIYIYIYIGTTL